MRSKIAIALILSLTFFSCRQEDEEEMIQLPETFFNLNFGDQISEEYSDSDFCSSGIPREIIRGTQRSDHPNYYSESGRSFSGTNYINSVSVFLMGTDGGTGFGTATTSNNRMAIELINNNNSFISPFLDIRLNFNGDTYASFLIDNLDLTPLKTDENANLSLDLSIEEDIGCELIGTVLRTDFSYSGYLYNVSNPLDSIPVNQMEGEFFVRLL